MKEELEQVRIFNATSSFSNFETQKCYQNEPKFNSVCSRNNLHKIKDKAYIKKLDEYKSIGIHWIAFCMNAENVTYFNSFGVGYIPKEFKKLTGNKNIITNICRMQAYNSIMCGYFCIGFPDFMLTGTSLWDYTNSVSPNKYE